MTERQIFVAALNFADAGARAAFLDDACAADLAMRTRIEELLREQADLGSFLERPAEPMPHTGAFESDPAADAALEPQEGPGSIVGRYKLLQQIGEGGMGTVFLAQQTHPVQRKVALKVIKAGMDSGQVIARFEAE